LEKLSAIVVASTEPSTCSHLFLTDPNLDFQHFQSAVLFFRTKASCKSLVYVCVCSLCPSRIFLRYCKRVFKQHNFRLYSVNLTPKYLPFLCLCYQNPCALLLTGGICNGDVIVVCILPRIYIFLELETMNFIKLAAIMHCRDFAVIFLRFPQKCAVFFAIFCRDFLLSLYMIIIITVFLCCLCF